MRVERTSGRVLAGPLEPVYVYEAPVRLWHWATMVAFAVLGVTGYLIGSPPPATGGEATHSFFFGWIRMIHLVAGWAPSSLSGAAETGLVSNEGRDLRAAYERDWRRRHAERLKAMVG